MQITCNESMTWCHQLAVWDYRIMDTYIFSHVYMHTHSDGNTPHAYTDSRLRYLKFYFRYTRHKVWWVPLNGTGMCCWACSPIVGRSSRTLRTRVQILVLASFPGFSRIYRCYALSGKRRSRRRRDAIGDFENLQLCRCSVLRRCS
jgi:hypothetical protein